MGHKEDTKRTPYNSENAKLHELVVRLLKTWRGGKYSEEELEQLPAIWIGADNSDTKILKVRDQLFNWVLEPLPQAFQTAVSQKDFKVVEESIKEIYKASHLNAKYCAILYSRYFCGKKYTLADLEPLTKLDSKTVARHTQKGVEILVNRLRMENDSYASRPAPGYVPSTDPSLLIGVETQSKNIIRWLTSKGSSKLVSIEGIGGIGKTSLANHVMYQLWQNKKYEGFASVSARQQTFSPTDGILPVNGAASTLDEIISSLTYQLGQSHMVGMSTREKIKVLKNSTHNKHFLILIDNLETVEEVDTLIPQLIELAGKSEFLITSRQSLINYSEVKVVRLPELSLTDSLHLVHSEMQRVGLDLTLKESTFKSLYQIVGGVPLALKLVAAQFGTSTVQQMIDGITSSIEKYKDFYVFIYRRSWQLLDDIAQRLLMSMLSVSPAGEDQEWICTLAGLKPEEFSRALQQLRKLSLIEITGSVENPRYRIHRLTATFLQSDILNYWKDSPSL